MTAVASVTTGSIPIFCSIIVDTCTSMHIQYAYGGEDTPPPKGAPLAKRLLYNVISGRQNGRQRLQSKIIPTKVIIFLFEILRILKRLILQECHRPIQPFTFRTPTKATTKRNTLRTQSTSPSVNTLKTPFALLVLHLHTSIRDPRELVAHTWR